MTMLEIMSYTCFWLLHVISVDIISLNDMTDFGVVEWNNLLFWTVCMGNIGLNEKH